MRKKRIHTSKFFLMNIPHLKLTASLHFMNSLSVNSWLDTNSSLKTRMSFPCLQTCNTHYTSDGRQRDERTNNSFSCANVPELKAFICSCGPQLINFSRLHNISDFSHLQDFISEIVHLQLCMFLNVCDILKCVFSGCSCLWYHKSWKM